VRKQVVNIPSFVVRLDSQKHIDFALTSPYSGGRAGMWSLYKSVLKIRLGINYRFGPTGQKIVEGLVGLVLAG